MKRKIPVAVLAIFLIALLTLSIYAAEASASSTEAHAYVKVTTPADLLAVARMTNLLGWTGDSLESVTTELDAWAKYYNLKEYVRHPATSSRASAWIGDNEVAWDYWSQ